jgi:HEPN domain-containing protein
MIAKKTLRELVDQKLKDADVLIKNRRYAAAIYLAGYALEIALKFKICKIFKFVQGFPEDKIEFSIYQNRAKSQRLLAGAITQVKEIRTHDLNKLLFFSGKEYNIKLNYLNEWESAVSWNPEMRYKLQVYLKKDALGMVNAIKTIIQNIL